MKSICKDVSQLEFHLLSLGFCYQILPGMEIDLIVPQIHMNMHATMTAMRDLQRGQYQQLICKKIELLVPLKGSLQYHIDVVIKPVAQPKLHKTYHSSRIGSDKDTCALHGAYKTNQKRVKQPIKFFQKLNSSETHQKVEFDQ